MSTYLKSSHKSQLQSILDGVREKRAERSQIVSKIEEANRKLETMRSSIPSLHAKAASGEDADVTNLIVCERKINFAEQSINALRIELDTADSALGRQLRSASATVASVLYEICEEVKASVAAKLTEIFSDPQRVQSLAEESDAVVGVRGFTSSVTGFNSVGGGTDPVGSADHFLVLLGDLIAGRQGFGTRR